MLREEPMGTLKLDHFCWKECGTTRKNGQCLVSPPRGSNFTGYPDVGDFHRPYFYTAELRATRTLRLLGSLVAFSPIVNRNSFRRSEDVCETSVSNSPTLGLASHGPPRSAGVRHSQKKAGCVSQPLSIWVQGTFACRTQFIHCFGKFSWLTRKNSL